VTGRSPFDLTGRTALVTGGNQGLGKAFAIGLAEAGAQVAIAGRSAERNDEMVAEAAAAGHRIHPITADITRAADVDRMTGQAIEALGHLDILVNNAGTCYHGESWTVTEGEWDAVFDLNVKALWACSLAVGAHMRQRGSGSIVNIGSISALIVNRPQMQPAYNASKAAVHHLTKSLCRRMGSARNPGQCAGTRLREDGNGARRPAGVQTALDRRHASAALCPSGGDRAERGVPGERRRLVHHRFGARRGRRVHRMVTGTAVNRRIVVNGLHDVVVETVTEPVPVAGEARVRTTVVGICGSDLHAASGHHPFIDLPYRPGPRSGRRGRGGRARRRRILDREKGRDRTESGVRALYAVPLRPVQHLP